MTYGAQSETSELRKNISLVPEKMANAAEEKLCLRSKISPVKSPKKLKKNSVKSSKNDCRNYLSMTYEISTIPFSSLNPALHTLQTCDIYCKTPLLIPLLAVVLVARLADCSSGVGWGCLPHRYWQLRHLTAEEKYYDVIIAFLET